MRQSIAITAAVASTTTAQSASSLTFWLPGPANNPSIASGVTSTFPPVASIVSSDAATTVFALGCPLVTSTVSPSSIFNGEFYETCQWYDEFATYTIISSTRHVVHRTQDWPQASTWWTCNHDTTATKVTCDMKISGGSGDTNGPVRKVWGAEPDSMGNVIAFATAEVVTKGRFGEIICIRGYCAAPPGETTRFWDAVSETTAKTVTGGGSAATASAGAAGGFGVDAVRLAALVGGGAAAVW